MALVREQVHGGQGVGDRVVERRLRREPVVDGEHDDAERLRGPPAPGVLQLEVAEQAVPAVQEHGRRAGMSAVGRVAAQRDAVVREIRHRTRERPSRAGDGALVGAAPQRRDVGHAPGHGTIRSSAMSTTFS